jgi:LysR family transcriptional regulator, benzoate and cis,cis-muconate-responsive activator of ben and cat genes
MDLKLLQCFVALADVGQVGRAASLLALSQPALSMRIQRLERELGYALFDRKARGVQLTERGRRLLPHVHRLLARGSETAEAARLIGRGAFDRLHIGLTPIAALSFVPDALRRYLEAHPQVRVALTEGLSNDLEEAVAHGDLDFAVVHPPSPRDDLAAIEIASERYVAVLPAGHALAGRDALGAADLAGERIVAVRREVGAAVFDRIAAFLADGSTPVAMDQSATTSISLIGLVAAGAGIGFVVQSLRCIRRDDIRYLPLAGDAPTLGYALCHRPDMPAETRVPLARSIAEAAAAWRPPQPT